MIQFVPFADHGPDGQAQAIVERVARQATAWVARYAATTFATIPTQNLVVAASGQIIFYYTLTVVAEIDGTAPASWGDPDEPPEWKALTTPVAPAGNTPAAPPAVPAPPPAPAAESDAAATALAGQHEEIRALLRRLAMKDPAAFLWRWKVHKITELDARAAESMLKVLHKQVAELDAAAPGSREVRRG